MSDILEKDINENNNCAFAVFGPSHRQGGMKFLVEGDTIHTFHRWVELEGFEWVLRKQVLKEQINISDKTPAEALAQINEQTRGLCPVLDYRELQHGDFVVCKAAAEDNQLITFSGKISDFLHHIQTENGCKGFYVDKSDGYIKEKWNEMREGGLVTSDVFEDGGEIKEGLVPSSPRPEPNLPAILQRAENCRRALCEAHLYTQLCTFNDRYNTIIPHSDSEQKAIMLEKFLAEYDGFVDAKKMERGGEINIETVPDQTESSTEEIKSFKISPILSTFTTILQGKPPTLPDNEAAFVDKVKKDALGDIKYDKRHMTALGEQHGITNLKLMQELTELAIVLAAREYLLTEKPTLEGGYRRMIRLYENQVNLAHRTSTTYIWKQYSTPAPIAYLASKFCSAISGNISEPLYFEPSAGNGLLTIGLGKPENFIVNEIDYLRRRHLWAQGFREVWNRDASLPFIGYEKKFDAVITNPPFGSAGPVEYGGFQITGLEQIMALRALDTMKDDGRAAIIIGGHTVYDQWGKIQEGKNRNFFIYLHRFYDVLDVINISGQKLYSRMGTGFDIRLILIDKRKGNHENFPPLENKALKVTEPFSSQVMENWEQLFERVIQHV